jgi:hypothetical protein
MAILQVAMKLGRIFSALYGYFASCHETGKNIFCFIWLFASCHETGKNMPEKKGKKFLKINK